MHPIERLRYVARSSGAPAEVLVRETALALAAFGDDPAGLVTACRRIVARQPACGPIWWFCSRMLCTVEPSREARAAVEEIESDPTSRHLAEHVPDSGTVAVLGWQPQVGAGLARRGDVTVRVVDVLGEAGSFVDALEQRGLDAWEIPLSGLGAAVATADLFVVEASVLAPDGVIAVAGSRAAAAVARHAGVPVWLVTGVGRVLPGRIWDHLLGMLDLADEPWDADDELLPLDLVDEVVGPHGRMSVGDALRGCDCPIAAELLGGDAP